jgi:predicted Fe-Mo cluster-binding NifX family protein
MRIAVVSDDGNTISAHFGRARYYEVFEVEEGQIRSQETREKPGHHTFHQEHGQDHYDEHREHTHGDGAYLHMQQAGIKPVVTDIEGIQEAVGAYIDGTLIDHTEHLH